MLNLTLDDDKPQLGQRSIDRAANAEQKRESARSVEIPLIVYRWNSQRDTLYVRQLG